MHLIEILKYLLALFLYAKNYFKKLSIVNKFIPFLKFYSIKQKSNIEKSFIFLLRSLFQPSKIKIDNTKINLRDMTLFFKND